MFSALNPYLFWIKLAGFVLALAAAGYASHYVTKAVDDRALAAVQLADSKAQTASVTASLDQLQTFITNMHTADDGYTADITAINNALVVIKKEFNNATLKPLAADCRPDAGRLRVLTDAVAAANARASTGK